MPRALRNEYIKVLVIIPVAVLAIVLALSGMGLVSYSPIARLSIESLITCWASISVGLSLVLLRTRFTHAQIFLTTAFSSIVLRRMFILLYLLQIRNESIVSLSSLSIISNLHEMTLILLFLLLSGINEKRDIILDCTPHSILLVIVVTVLIPASLYVAGYYLALFLASVDALNLFVVLNLVSIFVICGILLFSLFRGSINRLFEHGYFLSAVILLVIAALFTVASIISSSDMWVYAENLEVSAIFLFGISLARAYLVRVGITGKASYSLYSFLAITAYLPALLSTTVDVVSDPINLQMPDYFAHIVIDFGVGFLFTVIAWLLYSYYVIRPTQGQSELILVFGLWSSVFIVPITTSIFHEAILRWPDRALTPYIVMNLLTMILFTRVVFHTVSSTNTSSVHAMKNGGSLFFKTLFLILLVVVGSTVQFLIIDVAGVRISFHLDVVLLLTSSLLIILLLSYLIFTSCETFAPRVAPETYVLSFLAFCTIPNILRSFHPLWSIGWWIAELFLFSALLVGPVVLVMLYKGAMAEAQQSQRRARLYADLLMHDITNYNQMILTSLELLTIKSDDEVTKATLSDARRALVRSTQLIRNVRLLSFTEEEPTHHRRRPMDLVKTLVQALDSVTNQYDTRKLVLRLSTSSISAPVLATEELPIVFSNILISALHKTESAGIESAELLFDISESKRAVDKWWTARLYVPGVKLRIEETESTPSSHSDGIKDLGLFVAKALVESIGGFMYVLDNPSGSVVCIELPMMDLPIE